MGYLQRFEILKDRQSVMKVEGYKGLAEATKELTGIEPRQGMVTYDFFNFLREKGYTVKRLSGNGIIWGK